MSLRTKVKEQEKPVIQVYSEIYLGEVQTILKMSDKLMLKQYSKIKYICSGIIFISFD